MKYVMFRLYHKEQDKTEFFPVIFTDTLNHSQIASLVPRMRVGDNMNWVRPEAVSAGFVRMHTIPPECFGYSESTDLKSHRDDAAIIEGKTDKFSFDPRKNCKIYKGNDF